MFLTLLFVTLLIAGAVSVIVARAFTRPLDSVLQRIIGDAVSHAWLTYLKFAIVVVGISTGVRIQELTKYLSPARADKEGRLVELTGERWVFEIYRTVLDTLQGIAWLLLVFFVFALIAHVIVRIAEMRFGRSGGDPRP